MIRDDSLVSVRAAASSTNQLRMCRKPRSPASTIAMPANSTHSVSVAWLGTTRSYTFITNSGMASANRLTNSAASSTSA